MWNISLGEKMITEKENIIKLNETVQKNKNYQIEENRKLSRRVDELEERIKDLEKCHHMGSVNIELAGK